MLVHAGPFLISDAASVCHAEPGWRAFAHKDLVAQKIDRPAVYTLVTDEWATILPRRSPARIRLLQRAVLLNAVKDPRLLLMALNRRYFPIRDNPGTIQQQMVYFLLMISLEDARWSSMTGGYKRPFDPRPLLKKLGTDSDATEVWRELWEELHHQGDIGEASFAAIPFLVDAYRKRGDFDWNTCGIVAIIELSRKNGTNPDVPGWIAEDYFQSIEKLAEIATTRVLRAENSEDVRAMLGIIAIAKGLRIHGRFLVDYSEDELIEIESGTWIPHPVAGTELGPGGAEQKD